MFTGRREPAMRARHPSQVAGRCAVPSCGVAIASLANLDAAARQLAGSEREIRLSHCRNIGCAWCIECAKRAGLKITKQH